MASTLVEALKEGRYKNATEAVIGAEFNRQVDEERLERLQRKECRIFNLMSEVEGNSL